MRSIHLSVFVALCLGASVIYFVQCSEESFVQPIQYGPLAGKHFLTRKHFLKRRISYHPNCTASFQLELLHAGDVHPNPGPDREDGDTLSSSVRHHTDHHFQHATKYPPAELLQWRHPRFQLLQDVNDIIQSLGIHRRRTRRGSRGGQRKNSIRRKSHGNPSSNFQLCSVNVRSVCNKTALIHDFICDSNADLIAMTETWLTDNDATVLRELIPTGYRFVHQPRMGRRGGGTGLAYKETINVHQVAAA